MQSKINIRQICFMLISTSAIGKMIVAPAVTARYSQESLWISALIILIIDGLFALYFLYMNDRFGGKTFYSILESSVGKVAAKTVYSLFTVYFLFRAFTPIMEQKNYIEIALYETAPSVLTFLIFFLFSAYFCYKGFKGIARCADVCIWVAAFGICILTALSITLTDLSNLLPIVGVPAKNVLLGAKNTAVWYFDSAYILILMGHFKSEKGYKTKIMVSYGIMALIVIIYFAILYGEFAALTERQFFAPIQMGKSDVALSSIGRIDYIPGFIYALVCTFGSAIPLVFSSYCLKEVIPFKHKIIPPLIVNAVTAAAIIIAHDYFIETFRFISKKLVWGFAAVAYLLPLIMLFIKKRESV